MLLELGFITCDSSLFIYHRYLLIYVNNIIITFFSNALLQPIIASLHREFDITNHGAVNYLF